MVRSRKGFRCWQPFSRKGSLATLCIHAETCHTGGEGGLPCSCQAGVEVAALDPKALLIFSGGQTRAAAGPRDEGWSYYRVAEYFDWWGYSANRPDFLREARQRTESAGQSTYLPVAHRTVTEEFALDSFQNVLFSLCRFREIVGRYPDKITVVSFTFKKLPGHVFGRCLFGWVGTLRSTDVIYSTYQP